MVYKHAFSNILLLLYSAFMLCMVKLLLKGGVGCCALNSHGNYMVDHGKSWKHHRIVFLNSVGTLFLFCTFRHQSTFSCASKHQSTLHFQTPIQAFCALLDTNPHCTFKHQSRLYFSFFQTPNF